MFIKFIFLIFAQIIKNMTLSELNKLNLEKKYFTHCALGVCELLSVGSIKTEPNKNEYYVKLKYNENVIFNCFQYESITEVIESQTEQSEVILIYPDKCKSKFFYKDHDYELLSYSKTKNRINGEWYNSVNYKRINENQIFNRELKDFMNKFVWTGVLGD